MRGDAEREFYRPHGDDPITATHKIRVLSMRGGAPVDAWSLAGARRSAKTKLYLMVWRAFTAGSSTKEGRKRKEGERRGRKKKEILI
jgi:hypothetical protein